jgi:hypothetical protein
MGVAVLLFGAEVVTGSGWRSWMILTTFFVQSTVLSWLVGGSLGQVVCRLAVGRSIVSRSASPVRCSGPR